MLGDVTMQKKNAKLIKQINKRLVLKCIRDDEPISRADIAKKIRISRPTVSTLVNQLIEDEWVNEVGQGDSTASGGRKPINLMFNPKKYYIIGVDIGGTNVSVGMTDLNGEILSYDEFPTPQNTTDELFEKLQSTVEQMIKKKSIPQFKIFGMGVGVPGITNVQDGFVYDAPALGWQNYPVKKELEKYFDFPFYIDNDVNVGVLGEHWKGKGKDKKNIIYIAIGTGIGSGIIINNELYRGTNYSAGEMGHMVTDRLHAKDFQPTYSGYGFLESIAGGSAIGQMMTERINKKVHAKEVFNMYQEGSGDAKEVVNFAIENLALGIANYISLLNPEIIILGGGVSGAYPIIKNQINDILKRYTPQSCELAQTTFGKEAGVVGAAALFLKEHDSILNI